MSLFTNMSWRFKSEQDTCFTPIRLNAWGCKWCEETEEQEGERWVDRQGTNLEGPFGLSGNRRSMGDAKVFFQHGMISDLCSDILWRINWREIHLRAPNYCSTSQNGKKWTLVKRIKKTWWEVKGDRRGGDSFLAGQKTWWIRPLTGIKTRSEEPGFGNRRGRRDKPNLWRWCVQCGVLRFKVPKETFWKTLDICIWTTFHRIKEHVVLFMNHGRFSP